MIATRVIPCLLLRGRSLVKTRRFANPKYLGDPVNVVKIFNDKEVDEIVLLDIEATPSQADPMYDVLAEMTTELFIPLAYGGGVRTMEQVRRLFGIGIEKVVLNTAAVEHPELVTAAARDYGSQAVVVSIDVRSRWLRGRSVVTHGGRRRQGLTAVAAAARAEQLGAGEIFLTCVDRDGEMNGYDLELIRAVSAAVTVPVVACGGAGRIEHFREAVDAGATAAAAGSLFVFQGPHRAVLISYPSPDRLRTLFAATA